MLLTLMEIIDAIIMILGLGFIFMDMIPMPKNKEDSYGDDVDQLINKYKATSFDWKKLWYACLLIGPTILLHEMGHKFVGIYFGLDATFHAHYTFLLLGIMLKLMRFPFIVFVPGFVRITGNATPVSHSIVAFAGPAVHLLFWIGSWIMLKAKNDWDEMKKTFLMITMRVNMFLFIFNMLPIPGIDGFTVFSNILRLFA